MDDRCKNCERVAAELRAEFDRLRNEFVARNSALLADIEAKSLGLLAKIDLRVQRLFDTLSERLRLPPQRIDEEPPRMH